jgi:hypothetical protein
MLRNCLSRHTMDAAFFSVVLTMRAKASLLVILTKRASRAAAKISDSFAQFLSS